MSYPEWGHEEWRIFCRRQIDTIEKLQVELKAARAELASYHEQDRAHSVQVGVNDRATLLAENERLRTALKEVEWGGQYLDEDELWRPACPECSGPQKDGHFEYCAVAASLTGTPEENCARTAPGIPTQAEPAGAGQSELLTQPAEPGVELEALIKSFLTDWANDLRLGIVSDGRYRAAFHDTRSDIEWGAAGQTLRAALLELVRKVKGR